MKVLLILAVFACVVVLGSAERNDDITEIDQRSLNDQLRKAIENIKKQMPCGFPDWGLPPLAPLKVSYAEWTYEHFLFSILALVEDFRLAGANNFDVDDITLNILTLKSTFDFNFHEFGADSKYVTHLFLAKILNIKGAGDLDFRLQDLRIKGHLKLGLKGAYLQLKELDVKVALGNCKSNLTGILGGGLFQRIANRIIETFVVFFIKSQEELISKTIYDIAVPMANEVLSTLTIGDILKIIADSQKPVDCNPPPDMRFLGLH